MRALHDVVCPKHVRRVRTHGIAAERAWRRVPGRVNDEVDCAGVVERPRRVVFDDLEVVPALVTGEPRTRCSRIARAGDDLYSRVVSLVPEEERFHEIRRYQPGRTGDRDSRTIESVPR